METFALNSSPKKLRNTLIIAGSVVVGFSLIVVSLALIGNQANKSAVANAEIVYDNVVDFMNASNKCTEDTIQSVISFTYSEKTRRLMIGGAGASKIFVYDVTINSDVNSLQIFDWFLNKNYSNGGFTENSYGTYTPVNQKIESPYWDEITYQIYDAQTDPSSYAVCGTYRINNSFYSFTNYSLSNGNIIARENIKYKITKTNNLGFNFFKLVMQ